MGIKAESFDKYKRKYYEHLKKFNLLDSDVSNRLQECVGMTTDGQKESRPVGAGTDRK